jgi:Ca2+-binding RTX toxin-like protein
MQVIQNELPKVDGDKTMVLRVDPSRQTRLIGSNASEYEQLDSEELDSFPLEVWMLGGNDTIDGSFDSDLVYGNEGEDILRGGLAGNDSLFGGKGKDVLFSALNSGKGYLSGGEDSDALYGFGGNDTLIGGKGNDMIISGNGNNTLTGGLGKDYLFNVQFDVLTQTIQALGEGRNLYILQPDPSSVDVNSTDLIVGFNTVGDRLGLTGGLKENDLVLTYVTNVNTTLSQDFPALIGSVSNNVSVSGTLIQVKNSGSNVAIVTDTNPSQVQGRFISVSGF